VIELARSERLNWRELVGWRKLCIRLFPHDVDKAEILAKLSSKVKKEMKFQADTQKIGKIREEKVSNALQSLKEKGEIKSFFQTEKLDHADLMEGVDFVFRYIDGPYEKFCNFSVTGQKWVKQHEKDHPEIPVIDVYLKETKESIERKILKLLDRSKKVC